MRIRSRNPEQPQDEETPKTRKERKEEKKNKENAQKLWDYYNTDISRNAHFMELIGNHAEELNIDAIFEEEPDLETLEKITALYAKFLELLSEIKKLFKEIRVNTKDGENPDIKSAIEAELNKHWEGIAVALGEALITRPEKAQEILDLLEENSYLRNKVAAKKQQEKPVVEKQALAQFEMALDEIKRLAKENPRLISTHLEEMSIEERYAVESALDFITKHHLPGLDPELSDSTHRSRQQRRVIDLAKSGRRFWAKKIAYGRQAKKSDKYQDLLLSVHQQTQKTLWSMGVKGFSYTWIDQNLDKKFKKADERIKKMGSSPKTQETGGPASPPNSSEQQQQPAQSKGEKSESLVVRDTPAGSGYSGASEEVEKANPQDNTGRNREAQDTPTSWNEVRYKSVIKKWESLKLPDQPWVERLDGIRNPEKTNLRYKAVANFLFDLHKEMKAQNPLTHPDKLKSDYERLLNTLLQHTKGEKRVHLQKVMKVNNIEIKKRPSSRVENKV